MAFIKILQSYHQSTMLLHRISLFISLNHSRINPNAFLSPKSKEGTMVFSWNMCITS